ncbi:hypothetical protein B0T19DRAFT_431603 [Cercophora scortea]|uniref:Transmembrane protein n=1 Tax=Cercophora scortea TaxID=314031 RepID=A0AAE0M780_9PEZI|nr:hypothetical protein B0T19DRAFT_431603 [Cercophora scortea]
MDGEGGRLFIYAIFPVIHGSLFVRSFVNSTIARLCLVDYLLCFCSFFFLFSFFFLTLPRKRTGASTYRYFCDLSFPTWEVPWLSSECAGMERTVRKELLTLLKRHLMDIRIDSMARHERSLLARSRPCQSTVYPLQSPFLRSSLFAVLVIL